MSELTPDIIKTIETFIDTVRELAKIPGNIRFLVYDSSTPLDVLVEKIKEHYPFAEDEDVA